jgi:hypothetical protein
MANPFPFVAGSVLTAAELNGIGEASTSFTPTWSGLTVGNATQVWKYQRVNKLVFVYGIITFGSTTSVTGVMNFTPPIAAVAPSGNIYHGAVTIDDTGTGVIAGMILQTSATNFYPAYFNNSVNYETISAMTSTAPFTWTTGDVIKVQFYYEAA